jgi:hypothetical protein
MNSVRSGSTAQHLGDVRAVDVRHEVDGQAGAEVRAQRLGDHDRPEVGAADADVDDVGDGLAGVRLSRRPLRTASVNWRIFASTALTCGITSRRRRGWGGCERLRSATWSTARSSVSLILSRPANMRSRHALTWACWASDDRRAMVSSVTRCLDQSTSRPGARTCPSGSGAPCARTTRADGDAGPTSRTTTRAAAPTAGARTACSASPTPVPRCASRSRCGTSATRSSRSACSASTGPEGNHGEDVKEEYFYLDALPTHVLHARMLYKYPQAAFPYAQLVARTARVAGTSRVRAGRHRRVRRAIATSTSRSSTPRPTPTICASCITAHNRGPDRRRCTCCRSCGSATPGRGGATRGRRPPRSAIGDQRQRDHRRPRPARRARDAAHGSLAARRLGAGMRLLTAEPAAELLFTDNDTNVRAAVGQRRTQPPGEGRLPRYVSRATADAVNPQTQHGTKAALPLRASTCPAGGAVVLRLRLSPRRATRPRSRSPPGPSTRSFGGRQREADEFYDRRCGRTRCRRAAGAAPGLRRPALEQAVLPLRRRARLARRRPGPAAAAAAAPQARAATSDWRHLYNRDVMSMPDKWEYPWYAAWDLAFHMIPFALLDPRFAKQQLAAVAARVVHAPERADPGLRVRVRRREPAGARVGVLARLQDDRHAGSATEFLERAFHKLLLNFTWWVNRKDVRGQATSSGRLPRARQHRRVRPQPAAADGGTLEQADGTGVDGVLLRSRCCSIALELARDDPAYEDVASKFFEHFVAIADAMNTLGGTGPVGRAGRLLLRPDAPHRRGGDPAQGALAGRPDPAVRGRDVLETDVIAPCPASSAHGLVPREPPRPGGHHPTCAGGPGRGAARGLRLLAIPTREPASMRLLRTCSTRASSSRRSASARCRACTRGTPTFRARRRAHGVGYEPAESQHGLFGGNSNWRGPIWFPINFLLIESLQQVPPLLRRRLPVECPTGSGGNRSRCTRSRDELARRLIRMFLPTSAAGARATATTAAARSDLEGPPAVPRVLPRRHRRAASAPATRPAGPRWSRRVAG